MGHNRQPDGLRGAARGGSTPPRPACRGGHAGKRIDRPAHGAGGSVSRYCRVGTWRAARRRDGGHRTATSRDRVRPSAGGCAHPAQHVASRFVAGDRDGLLQRGPACLRRWSPARRPRYRDSCGRWSRRCDRERSGSSCWGRDLLVPCRFRDGLRRRTHGSAAVEPGAIRHKPDLASRPGGAAIRDGDAHDHQCAARRWTPADP